MRPGVDTETLARYQAATHYSVGRIIESGWTSPVGDAPQDEPTSKTFDREAIAAIAQVVFRKIGILAKDLEAFSKHAKRTKVTTDDVILCARRNPSLANKLKNVAKEAKEEKQDKLIVPRASAATGVAEASTKPILAKEKAAEVIDLSQLE